MLEGAGLRALLLLRSLPRVGDLRLSQLLQEHGSAPAALAALPALLPAAAAALAERRVLDRVARAQALIDRLGVSVLTPFDAVYPARLRLLHDPPTVLFALGDLGLAGGMSVAVIGARRATSYGRDAAHLFASGLARHGYHTVSGLARGIDGAAHQATLDAGGRTIAVVGCGLDVAYPPEHAELQQRIAAEGLLLSEFLPGEPPLPHHFPRRNRIIAALADAVLVVEAGAKSGVFITVDHALDLGREIFAVPGPIGRDSSLGVHQLIRDGATLVTDIADIVEVLDRDVSPGHEERTRAAGVEVGSGRGAQLDPGGPAGRPVKALPAGTRGIAPSRSDVGGPGSGDARASTGSGTRRSGEAPGGSAADGSPPGREAADGSAAARARSRWRVQPNVREGRPGGRGPGGEPEPTRHDAVPRTPGQDDGATEHGRADELAGGESTPAGSGAPQENTYRAILRVLRGGDLHIDEVASGVGGASAGVLAALLELELDGRIRQLPGMRFALRR
jgi:DNA processing protein